MRKNKRLHVWYDEEGDFLEFRVGKPVTGHFRPVGNECFERVNEKTGEVVGYAIFNFMKRFPKKHKEIDLPVEMILKSQAYSASR